MKRLALLLLVSCGGPGPSRTEAPPPDIYKNDVSDGSNFKPNPDFLPETPTYALKRSKLSLEGEVLVVEGDAQTVSSGGGGFGITGENQIAIVQEVLAEYPDVFDTIQIYTTFIDQNNVGTAYYQSISNSVSGIGVNTFNGRPGWGLPADGGRLSGFSNMNGFEQWGGLGGGLNRIEGGYHAVIAQELSHRWLFRMQYDLGDGNGDRDDLIGRQDAHWSRLAHSEGSVQDGQWWTKVGDRRFQNEGTDLGFAPLDNYAMGFIPADEVPDFFFLTNATTDAGDTLTKTSGVRTNEVVTADDNPVTMADVLRAMGPRNPPFGTENPYYRAAFVLVTAPGEPRSSWQPHLNLLQEIGRDFPVSWTRWSKGNSALCTKVTERCPEPNIGLADHEIVDEGDGLIGPGDTFELGLSIINSGVGTARNVVVALEPIGAGSTLTGGPITVPEAEESGTARLPSNFSVTISSTVACGDTIAFRATMSTEEGPIFKGELTLGVGTKSIRIDRLDEAPDWRVDPDETDTALRGQWDLGEPDFASVLGIVTQPGSDHSPGESKLSFHTGPSLLDSFSANDVDGGHTTLQSPPFALRDTRDPSLVFWFWRQATDFSVRPMAPLDEDSALIVQASNDGGESWHELGRVAEQTEEWTRAEMRIRDAVEPTNRVMFRFIISDESVSGTVEAGIDDVEIVDFLDSCELNLPMGMDAGVTGPGPGGRDEGGCGCTSTSTGTSAGLIGLLLLGLLLSRRRV